MVVEKRTFGRERRARHIALLAAMSILFAASGPVRAAPGQPPPIHVTTEHGATALFGQVATPAPVLLGAAFLDARDIVVVGDAGLQPYPAAHGCTLLFGHYCAAGGFVLASHNAGRTWRRAYEGGAELDTLIPFSHGGAVAWGPDALVMTSNGGASWSRLGLPPGATSFAELFFASATDGWALVSAPSTDPLFGNEALFATSDGGRRWVEIDRDPTYPYHAPGALTLNLDMVTIAYFGHGHGAVGQKVTVDGGRHWQRDAHVMVPTGMHDATQVAPGRWVGLQYVPIGPPPYSSDTPNATYLMGSTDGGQAWKRMVRVPATVTGLSSAPDGSLWAVAETVDEADAVVGMDPWQCPSLVGTCGRTVWVSLGGGRRWQAVPGTPAAVAAVVAVAPADAGRAVVVTLGRNGTYAIDVLQRSAQRWTWSTTYHAGGAQEGAVGPTLSAHFWTTRAGWGEGTPTDPRAILFTADGGRKWHVTGQAPMRTNIAFTDPRHGYGYSWFGAGALVATRDGGRSWYRWKPAGAVPTVGPMPQPAALWSPKAVGLYGLDASDRNVLAWTVNSGRSWLSRTFPAQVPAGDPAVFALPDVGWAVGKDPSWHLPPGTPATPFGGPFPPQVLFKTVPGGTRWVEVARLGAGRGWNGGALLAATGTADVWLVEDSSALRVGRLRGPVLLHSMDGGGRWAAYALPAAIVGGTTGIDGLSAVNSHTAWLQTSSGLWRTRDGGAVWVRVARA